MRGIAQTIWHASFGLFAAIIVSLLVAMPAHAANSDQDLILGIFWNSDQDPSDTLYVSANGLEFKRIGTPIKTAGNGTDNAIGLPVDYVHAIHDPGLFYKNGTFWMVGGYVQSQSGLGWRLTPMFSSSRDLIHWSYPNSGSQANLAPTTRPQGTQASGQYDTAGTEAFADDDGTVWLVTTLGYFAMNHGQSSSKDVMTPYICKISGLEPGADPASNPSAQPKLSYGDLLPINLPSNGSNWLDPSLYKENGTYYLSIKKDGVTNQIYSIKDLNRAQDPNAWTLVCGNVVTGYEGPSLTNLHGRYLMYTDKLKDYPFGAADGTAGTFVTKSDSLNGSWYETQRIYTLGLHADGSMTSIPNRHGSVLRVPAEARNVVESALAKAGWPAYKNSDSIAFHDVNYASWYAEGAKFCSAKGLISGIAGTREPTFGVGQSLTRAQLAAILWRNADPSSAAHNQKAVNETGMADVESNAWYTGAANWAVKEGVIGGFQNADGSKSFGPDTGVSLEQLITIIANYKAKDAVSKADQSVLSFFTDGGRISSWARGSVAWGKSVGLVNGYVNANGTHTLRPDENVTRERAATILMNAFEKGILN